jgi:tRNA modification GTPase
MSLSPTPQHLPCHDRVSILTATGRGAVAVVAACGRVAFQETERRFEATRQQKVSEQPSGTMLYGIWHHDAGDEDVVVWKRSAQQLEIHCHGGEAAAPQIAGALETAGCRKLSWAQWLAAEAAEATQRGEANSPSAGSGELELEVRTALAAAPTERIAAILLDQLPHTLADELQRLAGLHQQGEVEAAREGLQMLRRRASWGVRLTRPWRVVLAGRANVGKSSLMNAVLGYERSIVWDLPGVTRDLLTADLAIEGWPIELIDAAGLGATADPLGASAAQQARRALAVADLVLWVVDGALCSPAQREAPHATAEAQIAEVLGEDWRWGEKPWVAVLNKWDLCAVQGGLPEVESGVGPSLGPAAIATSALTGAGIEALLARVRTCLLPEVPPPGAAVPFTTRQLALVEQAWEEGKSKWTTS